MNCSEAVEWMNRYLDRELDKEEQLQLFQHLDSCEECAETFDLMRAISRRLESLPDVTPNYSLVDRIMPQLEAIDRERKGIIADSPLQDEQIPLMDSIPERKSELIRSKPRNRYGLRLAGGAAAAMILAFCIYQFQPKTIPNAEPPAPEQQQTALAPEDSSNNADQAAEDQGSNPQLKQDTAPERNIREDSESEASSSALQNPSNSGDRESQPSDRVSQKVEDSGKSADSSSAADEPKPADSSKAADSAKPDQSAKSSPSGGSGANSNGAEDKASNTQSKGKAAGTDGAQLNEDKAPTEDEPVTDTPPAREDKVPMFGITSVPSNSSQEWSSPDGKYVASLEDNQLNIYDVTSSERKRVYGNPLKGELVKGEWAPDSSVFAYETEQDGKSSGYQFTAPQSDSASNGK
ncbi:hypothetical protein DCC85_15230 [Paenibacillus sp. CAA11]|uniref:zf-HC2 domain-containing protein n=1 Tax=Paenibacillus sp. CAA11 TaxID=1532905 RepID=UPI000D3A7FC6|nr:zf-HC2 domain-containing protein [Paenibacillus sp. CAA11]AWB45439.1 hypothetical protein DCC85_15230 [Paenibacillus sp. CAA11]